MFWCKKNHHPQAILQVKKVMVNKDELVIMRAIALCFKPFLKPEEAQIYTNLGKSQLAKKAQEMGVYKNVSGYYKREELDTLMNGSSSPLASAAANLRIKNIR